MIIPVEIVKRSEGKDDEFLLAMFRIQIRHILYKYAESLKFPQRGNKVLIYTIYLNTNIPTEVLNS